MIRQYHAQRSQGGDNPLRVGVIAVGSLYYLQDESFFRDRFSGRPVYRTPWMVEAFLNGTMGASRRNQDTGLWESTYRARRSDMVAVRSLRDRRQTRLVAVHLLIVHDDLCLWKEATSYPTLPDIARLRQSAVLVGRTGTARRLHQRLGCECPHARSRPSTTHIA